MVRLYFIGIIMIALGINASAQHYQTPSWVTNIPLHGEFTAIGISDPRIEDDSLALLQAEMRAKAIIAMLHETDISYTSQYYQVETESHRTYKLNESIEKLGKYKSRLPYNETDFEVISQHKNKNNETILLMAYQDDGKAKSNVLKVTAEYYAKIFETSITRSYRMAELTKYTIRDSTCDNTKKYDYTWEADGNHFHIVSTVDTTEINMPGYQYRYLNTDTITNFAQYGASRNAGKGLWEAYLHAFILSISSDSKNYTTKIKNLGDDYDKIRESSENYQNDTKQQELSRHITKNRMHFYLHGFRIYNNKLYLHISSPLLDQQSPRVYSTPSDTTSDQKDQEKKRSFWDWLFGR
ncbi:MAG: hypothetical protein U9Q98_02245 [Bacteroidota bacterium]|nr:hypothetical protein [Bacteroidota bacterium]